MNKNHRVVWSEHRQAFVVAHEAATSRAPGPSSSSVSSVAKAVAALALSVAAHQATATPACFASGSSLTISASQNYGCYLQTGGSIVVNSGVSVTGDFAIVADTAVAGSIQNAGHLFGQFYSNTSSSSSGGGSAISIYNSTVASITNTGTIQGDKIGIQVQGGSVSGQITGDITNSALITGGDYGIYLAGTTVGGGISNTGTIRGDSDAGIYIHTGSIAGDISNSLIITGGQRAIELHDTTIDGVITNSGTLTGSDPSHGSGWGVSLENSRVESIVNSGQIFGFATNVAYGIDVTNSTIAGGITNSGIISGTGFGVLVNDSTIVGSIVNQADGSILGNGYGILVNDNAVLGGIQNAGAIYGGEGSMSLDNTISGFIVDNTGTLDGAVWLGINTLNLNGPSSRVMGRTRGSSDSTVNINGTFTSEGLFRVGTFNVTSAGVFNQNHGVTVTGGATNSGVWDVGSGGGTITGDYAQFASGTLRFSLTDASTYGSLNVSGVATVADASKVFVNVIGSPTLVNGSTIAGVLTAGDTLTVNASTLAVNDNSALYKFSAATVSDPGHALDLIVSADSVGLPNAVKDAGFSAAAGAANALQTIFNDGVPTGMQQVFDKLNNMTDSEAAAAVSQTLPSITGASSQAGINALHSMNKIIQSRVESVQGLSSGDGGADRYTWVRAFGNWSDQNNRGGVAGFKSETGGLVIGADAPVSDKVRAGGAFTYAKSNIKSKSSTAASKVDVDTFELVGYASYNIDPRTDINYQLDVGMNKASSSRDISFMGTRATADFDSVVVHGSVGIGRLMPISAATNWTPSVRVDYTHMRTEGYTEEGAGPLNLDINSQTYREFLLTGDAKISHQFEGGVKLLANASLGYDVINKQAKTTSTFTGGGPAFVTDGLDVSPWFYRLGAGLVKESGTGVEYSLRYDMEGRTSGYVNQSVSAKVRWAF